MVDDFKRFLWIFFDRQADSMRFLPPQTMQTNSRLARRHKCSVSVPAPLLEAARRKAARDSRSMSGYVTHLIARDLSRAGVGALAPA
jgi:hypothetical protein